MLFLNTYRQLVMILLTALTFCACEPEAAEADNNADASEAGAMEMMSENEAGTEVNTEAGTEAGTETSTEMTEGPWGESCVEDSDCTAPTDFCVKQPGMSEGYCTYACTNNQECQDLEAPESWTCNTLSFSGCEDIPSNWCGPQSELTDFPGIIIECQ